MNRTMMTAKTPTIAIIRLSHSGLPLSGENFVQETSRLAIWPS
jgi:hypothetical protein